MTLPLVGGMANGLDLKWKTHSVGWTITGVIPATLRSGGTRW